MNFKLSLTKLKLKNLIWSLPLLFVLSLGTFLIFQRVQIAQDNTNILYWVSANIGITILNTFFIFFIYLLIIALIGNFTIGTITGCLVLTLLCYANSKKILVLGEPIYPVDFYQVLEIKSLLKFVQGSFSPIYIVILLLAVFLIIKFIKKLPKFRLTFSKRLAAFLISAFMIYSYINFTHSFLKDIVDKSGVVIVFWNQPENYSANGFMMGLLSNFQNEIMPKPVEYNEESVLKIAEKYKQEALEINKDRAETSDVKPNIVFVMSESFWDPTRFTNVDFSEDPMKNIRNLMADYSSGYMLSPSFGGSTANVEFEALTGLSMYHLLSGTVPYQQAFPEGAKVPSLASMLKEDNYDTIAIHPYNKIFYKRYKVYPALGFDDFISEETISYKDRLNKEAYISDQSVVDEIWDRLNKEDKPQFIHAVTMQNHLPVFDGKYGNNSITVSGLSSDNEKELETYSEGIKKSDMAMKDLVDKLSTLEEPTILVFWGDHLPAVNNSIYEEAKYSTDDKNENERKLSETPLFIYSNYGLEKQELKTMSPAFLGVTLYDILDKTMPPYYAMLEEIKSKVIGLKSDLLIDPNGNIKSELTEEEKQLLEEYKLIQYDLLIGDQYSLPALFDK